MCASKKLSIFLVFIMCFCLVSSGCVEKKTPEEKLDKYIQNLYSKYDGPTSSIAVLVVDDGKILFNKSYGYANVDTLEKATSNTNYRIASLTKMFTAMSIMILKDRGQLDYDTKVIDILEDFPEYGKDITIRHLLMHTSGLKDFYELTDLLDKEFNEENQLLDADVYEIVKKSDSTYFEPGQIHRYSDAGYIVLGLIVEKISGMTLSDFMDKNIFKPLHMDNTLLYDKMQNPEIKNRAYGTEYRVNKFITSDQSFSSATRGDGGVYTSLDDLYKWDQALYDGMKKDILVHKETLREAYTPPKMLNGSYDNYNFGWMFRKNGNMYFEQYHTGGTQGFITCYLRLPDQKKTFIILSNRNDDEAPWEIDTIIRELYGFGVRGMGD